MYNLADNFVGALLGTAVGDALGMPIEGFSFEVLRSLGVRVNQMIDGRLKAGSYTDDTEMTICIAESIADNGSLDLDDIATRFILQWDPRRGYGFGTVTVLEWMRSGIPWRDASKRLFSGGSYGNGAAMRTSAVALHYFSDESALREASRSVATITHYHPLGIQGAEIMAVSASMALRSSAEKAIDPDEFLSSLIENTTEEEFMEKLRHTQELLQRRSSEEEVVELLGNGATAHGSVPASIYCFLANLDSFEDAVVQAINLGGDTDTIGAMTGALSGAYHGKTGIPGRWLESLENGPKGRDYIERLGVRLWQLKSGDPDAV